MFNLELFSLCKCKNIERKLFYTNLEGIVPLLLHFCLNICGSASSNISYKHDRLPGQWASRLVQA